MTNYPSLESLAFAASDVTPWRKNTTIAAANTA
jgi:hypothetical protein